MRAGELWAHTGLGSTSSQEPVPPHTGSLGATGVSGLPAAGTRNRPLPPPEGREAVAGPRGWDSTV